jgi:hypothetical protein
MCFPLFAAVLRGELSCLIGPGQIPHLVQDAPVGDGSQPDEDKAHAEVRLVEGGHSAAGRGSLYIGECTFSCNKYLGQK